MSENIEAIVEAALRLPSDDQQALVARLLKAIPLADTFLSMDDPELEEELERRFADRGNSIPWDDLKTNG